ncbi:hypothetical protein OG394_02420 [Kribbella sp. NBC_01245]|uniref:hypothetical protein n=1 Tax=Kribbella sp. NBC_01245 TaxID=2903578 RepID=UPI002E28FA81|nr:hypothetical protein [Kribbella sp. NBC_01245]
MNITLAVDSAAGSTTKLLVLALIVVVAVVVGMVAGGLSRLGGTGVPHAILRGGTAFAGAVALLLSVVLTFDLL